ncbi:MAG: flagellin [Bacillota bacterium]
MAQGDLTRIAANISGLNALNALKAVNAQLGIRQLRLSTGKRINEAADDPAGLTIATKFSAKSRGLGVALDNIGDAKNLLSVAEGSLNKINDILLLIRDKAGQAANDTLGDAERTAINDQINQLLTEVDKIVDETEWNGQKLIAGGLNLTFQTGFQADATTAVGLTQAHTQNALGVALGSVARAVSALEALPSGLAASVGTSTPYDEYAELTSGVYQVTLNWDYDASGTSTMVVTLRDGAGNIVKIDSNNADDGASNALANSMTIAGTSASFANLVINTGRGLTITMPASPATSDTVATFKVDYTKQGGSVSSNTNATAYMRSVDQAISTISSSVKNIGAVVSRLTFKEENLVVAKSNTEAAYNRIMNADMAAEQLEAMKLQILQQTATAMLAQANTAPQAVLGLFR